MVYRKLNPSLDSLLDKLAAQPDGNLPEASAMGKPMAAQMEAIARSGRKVSAEFRIEIDEKSDEIRILGPNSPGRNLVVAGEVLLAMRLKAAELHLHAVQNIAQQTTSTANPLLATLVVSL